jgi:hypothetical protein
MERVSLQVRRERLSQLALKVGPVTFARDRALPVDAALQPLLPEGGLMRGSIIGCQGGTALSVALALVTGASAAGSWLAVVGVPSLGLRAAAELGIALERLVMVADPADPGPAGSETSWATVMSALIDGFDIVVVRSAPQLRPGTARKLQARLQARGSVLIVVDEPGPFVCDLVVTGRNPRWEGLELGAGRLQRRRLTLVAGGRRLPRHRQVDVWLPGVGGGLEAVGEIAVPNVTLINDSSPALGTGALGTRDLGSGALGSDDLGTDDLAEAWAG